jgi:tetratricopeptide (TPR) repeat protein
MIALLEALLVVGLAAGATDANPTGLPKPPGSAAQSQPAAEALFHAGLKAYDAHDYSVALKLFQDAYSQSHEPEILFDIGQTFRALGNCQEAIAHFDAFIAAVPSDDPLLPRVRGRRAELLPCGPAAAIPSVGASQVPADRASPASEDRARVAPLARSPSSLQAVPPLQAPRERAIAVEARLTAVGPVHDRSALRTACIGSATGSVALALVGGVFGLEAYSTAQAVQLTTTWDQSATQADERGRTLGQIATTLFISAGAVAAVAAVTCSLGWWRR